MASGGWERGIGEPGGQERGKQEGLASGRDAGLGEGKRDAEWKEVVRRQELCPYETQIGEGAACRRKMQFTIQAGTLSRMRVYKGWETDAMRRQIDGPGRVFTSRRDDGCPSPMKREE